MIASYRNAQYCVVEMGATNWHQMLPVLAVTPPVRYAEPWLCAPMRVCAACEEPKASQAMAVISMCCHAVFSVIRLH